ncbi:MAG: hypothetical protein ACJASV_000115 [Pseudorhodobacter sp.]|jgi:hypothetical protein
MMPDHFRGNLTFAPCNFENLHKCRHIFASPQACAAAIEAPLPTGRPRQGPAETLRKKTTLLSGLFRPDSN